MHLHFHAEVKGIRAAEFQILVKEDELLISKTITDKNGFFTLLISKENHTIHSEIKEPTFDIYYIPRDNSLDTILIKSLTHFDAGRIKLKLYVEKRGIVPEENGMSACLKCLKSDMVKELEEDVESYARFICQRDHVKF